jgi:Outer membrane protein beta-barrel domain
MMARSSAAIALTFLALSSTPAHAQGFISPFLGFAYGGDVAAVCRSLTSCEDRRSNWGVAFGSARGVLGFEEEIGYAKNFFGDTPNSNNSVLTVMSNLMVVVPAGPVRPYGVIGLGLVRPHFALDSSTLAVTNNSLGYDFGGGVNIFFSQGFGIRGDIRHIETFDDLTLGIFQSDKLNFWRGSAGLVFRF